MSSIARQVRRARPARRCIFCGAGKLTREHIWPAWAGIHFERTEDDQHTLEFGTYRHNAPPTEPTYRHRQGRVVSVKLKVVCAACNSGWMSRLEESAKPVLQRLILGVEQTLTEDDQRLLVRWVTLKMMVAEQLHPEHAVFGQADRTAFMETREPPSSLQVWIARCGKLAWASAYRRRAATFTRPNAPPPPRNTKNVQSMALGFGDLFVLAVHGLLNQGVEVELEVAFFPVSPFLGAVRWPPGFRISAEMALAAADILDDLSQRPGVEHRELYG